MLSFRSSPAARLAPAAAAIMICAAFLLAVSLSSTAVRAAGTPPSPPPPPQQAMPSSLPAATPPDSAAEAAAARDRAEGLYKKAYKETEEAKADLKAGKAKDAGKKFARALKRFDEATQLDPVYFEAWNMVGFCARKTGDLKRAFAAYERALEINPDYEEAHEYLGEAYVMSGDLAKAREQLGWLKEKKSEEAGELEESIEAAERAGAGAQAGSAGH
jgi:tetratricopeptide (TPR) repeat protein